MMVISQGRNKATKVGHEGLRGTEGTSDKFSPKVYILLG